VSTAVRAPWAWVGSTAAGSQTAAMLSPATRPVAATRGHPGGHRARDPPLQPRLSHYWRGRRAYIYVQSVDETLHRVATHGGTVVDTPCPEGDLWVATFRDPTGNVLGVWQRGPRN
jgi:predicted enzyme related to lactoylglutathione lyase